MRTKPTGAMLILAAFAFCRAASALSVWIDTDPSIGSPIREVDDAYALLVAFRSPELQIAGVSTTYGNASVARTTGVALDLVRRFGAEAGVNTSAVYPGAKSAGDLGHPTPASEALALRLAGDSRLTYIALGPLTNLATLIRLHPETASQIERVILLGGRGPGVNPGLGSRGEFHIHDANIFKDPAAGAVVIDSRIPLSLVPIETASHLALHPAELDELRKTGAAGAFLFANSQTWMWFWTRIVRSAGAPVFDACAVLVAAQPALFRTELRSAEMNASGDLVATRGRTGTQRSVRWYGTLPPAAKSLFLARLRNHRPQRD